MAEKITDDQMQEFWEFLRGESIPDGMTVDEQPKLTDKAAFAVIYYLQERLRILPDAFEMCKTCHQLYDSDSEGFSIDDSDTCDGEPVPEKYHGTYCEFCIPAAVD